MAATTNTKAFFNEEIPRNWSDYFLEELIKDWEKWKMKL
jgi:hypothetical protein